MLMMTHCILSIFYILLRRSAVSAAVLKCMLDMNVWFYDLYPNFSLPFSLFLPSWDQYSYYVYYITYSTYEGRRQPSSFLI